MPLIFQYLPKHYNSFMLNHQLLQLYKVEARYNKALHHIVPVSRRLQACYQARKLFVHRLKNDIQYRLRYLFVHDTDTPHICWKRVPPRCIAVHGHDGRLANCVRLLKKEIDNMSLFMARYRHEQYEWLLRNFIYTGTP